MATRAKYFQHTRLDDCNHAPASPRILRINLSVFMRLRRQPDTLDTGSVSALRATSKPSVAENSSVVPGRMPSRSRNALGIVTCPRSATTAFIGPPEKTRFASMLHGLRNEKYGSKSTMRELAEVARDVVSFQGRLSFVASKPDGAPRTRMDNSRPSKLGWAPGVSMRDGVRMAYDEFKSEMLDSSRA